ncbi:MAG: hypothetical protein HOL16_08365 [Alphaproteobacteria bacterium]|jgi:glutamyl endopeptidase|nr:hypothetical protein [Alphaproteobacteria bacterium]
MITMKGPVIKVDDKRIFYDIDTSGGQSGSGVYDVSDNPTARYVLTYGSDDYNIGTRVNQLMIDWIKGVIDYEEGESS